MKELNENQNRILLNDLVLILSKHSNNTTTILVDLLKVNPNLINYLLSSESGLRALNNLEEYELFEILASQPDLIEGLKNVLYKLGGLNISNILLKHPDLMSYFSGEKQGYEDVLNKLESFDIKLLLENHPKLMPYFSGEKQGFDNVLHKLDSWNISEIIINQPELMPYFSGEKEGFKNVLDKIKSFEIRWILSKQPQLEKYFKK